MSSCGDICNLKKTIIPHVASVRAKFNRKVTVDDDNTDDMYIAIGLTHLINSAVL